ncbi:MAG: O-antigen ligase family protein [Acidimicrobiia bacterium]
MAVDSIGFLEAVAGLPEQLDAAHELAGSLDLSALPKADAVDSIAVLGMGGSGIAGDVLAAVGSALPVPVVVLKQYRTPAFVGPRTLVFAMSFSGDTEETVSMTRDAFDAGAHVVTVASGGALDVLAGEHGGLRIPCPSDIPVPRAALGALVAPLFVSLFRMGIFPEAHAALVKAQEQLKRRRDQCRPEVEGVTNPARELARRIPGRNGRAVAVVAGALGAGCLAGAWLSGSRGAVIATGLGLVAVVPALARGGALRRGGTVLAAVVVAAVAIGVGLEGMVASEGGQPLASREHTASHNLSARFGYWEAAVGMAVSRPLTGWGPGSYRWASVPHYPDDTNLTSSAHNEYVEALGETGLPGALPVWLAALAVAGLAAMTLLAPHRAAPSAPRHAGAVAAAAAAVVLGLHAGLDFDWDYPLLAGLLAIAAGVLWAHRAAADPTRAPASRVGGAPTAAAVGATLVLAGVALAGAAAARRGPPPWELNRALSGAVAAVDTGGPAAVAGASGRLAAAARWNPGAPSIPILTTLLGHSAGTVTDSSLAAAVDPRATPHPLQILAARRLHASGDGAAALELLEGLKPVLLARRHWGVWAQALDVAALEIRLRAELEGCDAAAARVDPARRWLREVRVEPADVAAALAEVARETGCPLLRAAGT